MMVNISVGCHIKEKMQNAYPWFYQTFNFRNEKPAVIRKHRKSMQFEANDKRESYNIIKLSVSFENK